MPFRAVVMLGLAAFALSAQITTRETLRDTAPVRYWSAPLYWQPSAAERSASPKLTAASASSSSANALTFVALTPCRVIDTRSALNFPAPFGAPSLVGGATRSFPFEASTLCSIPSTALAYSLNVTVTPVGGAGLGYLTVWPSGAVQPNASTLNNPNALPALANAAIVPAGNDGQGSINAFASDATDLIVDVNGYYEPQTNLATDNTSVGQYSLGNSTTGSSNVAMGFTTLENNTSGNDNTGTGTAALNNNTTGSKNTAAGYQALMASTTGGYNTAIGASSLSANSSGGLNTAVGGLALLENTTGQSNIALGYTAGDDIQGSNNIDIGNQGTSSDSGVIRIGTQGTQTTAYVAGVYDVPINCCLPVYVSASGQLGMLASSQRYKENIRDMGDASSRVMDLRSVTFRYKKSVSGGSNAMQYGLIAEEVARIYPDLVVRDADGEIQAVQYEKLTPMLLNELQKQSEVIQKLEGRLEALEEQQAADK